MKMCLVKKLMAMILVLLMAAPSALAVQYVTFEDIPGEWNNYEAAINWMVMEYAPTSDHAWLNTEFLEGGEVSPGVFEYLADPSFAYQNPGIIYGYFYIDAPGDVMYVNVFEGNWATKEYMFMNCIGTDGLYVDALLPSFDKDGKLLTTDRVYLYEYQVDGEWYYNCVTLYFRYDGEETRSFLPKVTKSISQKETDAVLVGQPVPAPEVTPTPVPEVMDEPVTETEVVDTTEPAPAPEVTPTPATEIADEPVAETETDETTEPAEEEDVGYTENETEAIGIIGGADGPTVVFIYESDGFSGFLGNFVAGVVKGFEEGVSDPAALQSATEPETVTDEAETDDEAEDVVVLEEPVYEDVYEEEAAETESDQASGGVLDFFSGVIGGLGK